MKTCRGLVAFACALGLVLAFAPSAFATVIPVPDQSYLGNTTKIDLSPYYWTGVGWPPPPAPSISDARLTVSFSAPEMFGAYAPGGYHANSWGDDGVVESTSPMPGRTATTVPWAGGLSATTMSLSAPVTTFGFEVASLWQSPASGYTAVVTFKRNGTVVDTITKSIPAPTQVSSGSYQSHAQFFAATSPSGFDQVVLTTLGGPPGSETGLFVAQYRYAMPAAPQGVVFSAAAPTQTSSGLRPKISVRVYDPAGVDMFNCRMRLDGLLVRPTVKYDILETLYDEEGKYYVYDYNSATISYQPTRDLKAGAHTVEVIERGLDWLYHSTSWSFSVQ